MWPNPQKTVTLVTFTEEILNEKCSFFVPCVFKHLFGILITILDRSFYNISQRFLEDNYFRKNLIIGVNTVINTPLCSTYLLLREIVQKSYESIGRFELICKLC